MMTESTFSPNYAAREATGPDLERENQPHPLQDSFGRHIEDVRISVTDRCNFRCLYCLPETEEAASFYQHLPFGKNRPGADQPLNNSSTLGNDGLQHQQETTQQTPIHRKWTPKSKILTYEEIRTITEILVKMGVRKIRLTGGEPLLRKHLEQLVQLLSELGPDLDLALTTNGFDFCRQAEALKSAGLKRVTFSMDSLDRENFIKLTGRDGLEELLKAIQLARKLDYRNIKVNAVIIRGVNDHELESLVAFGRQENLGMRFIEFMPLDSKRAWQRELVVSKNEILDRLNARYDLIEAPSQNPSETARRWRFSDLGEDGPELGIIAPVTEPFCGACNRIRLTADGQLRTCLFSLHESDLKPWLRGPESLESLESEIRRIVWKKEARHHIGESDFQNPLRSMSSIGG